MRIWTKEEDLDVWENYRGNASFFSDKFGVNPNVIVCRYQWLKKKGGVQQSVYWTQEQEQILISNWNEMKVTQIAKLLNKSRESVSTKATLLRRKGEDLPIKNFSPGKPPKAVGTISEFKNGQIREKQADGQWKYLGMVGGSKKRGNPQFKPKKPKSIKTPKPPKPKVTSAIRTNKPKAAPVEKKIKTFDPTGKVLVQIDSKTWVYRKVS